MAARKYPLPAPEEDERGSMWCDDTRSGEVKGRENIENIKPDSKTPFVKLHFTTFLTVDSKTRQRRAMAYSF